MYSRAAAQYLRDKSLEFTFRFALRTLNTHVTLSYMPFLNPFTSHKNKRSSDMYPPGFHSGSIVDLEWRSPHINETRWSTHDPIMQLDFGFSSTRRNSTSTQSQENVQQYLTGYDNLSSSDDNADTPFTPYTPYTPPPESSKAARYYSHALSNEDRLALAQGELNHNLQTWAPEDLVKHHESRKLLVPQGVGANKLRKMEAFAKIEEEKKHSQRALDKKVRGKALLPSFHLTNDKGQQGYIAYHPQASQSMYDLRSASTLVPQPSRHVPASPTPVRTLRRKYSWEPEQAPSNPHQNVRTAGGIDSGYSSFQPGPEKLLTPSSRTSNRVPSSRVFNPLLNKDTAQQHDPDMTFDTFLVPHKSGKGEAYRGSNNAKIVRAKASDDDFGVSAPGPAKENTLRRLKKMQSTPTLRQRFSRSGLRQESDEKVPDVPASP